MAVLFGKSVGGGSSLFTTPDQVTGLQAVSSEEGILLSVDQPTEESYEYLKDYWVTFKLASEGEIQHPYDGEHIIFEKPALQQNTLSRLQPGTGIKLMENDTPVRFILLKQGYESDDDGRTLLLRRDIYDTRPFGNSNYSESDIDTFLSGIYHNLLSPAVQSNLETVSIQCTSGLDVISIGRKIFLLSGTEVGFSELYMKQEGTPIPYFNDNTSRIALLSGSATNWWTRSHQAYNTSLIYTVMYNGTQGTFTGNNKNGLRPAFCLNGDDVLTSKEPDSDGDYIIQE